MGLLYVARKGTLGDKVMQTITAKLFGNNPSIIGLDCARFGAIIDGINVDEIKPVMYGVSDEKVLIPINCNGNHWCFIMIDLGNALLYYYDPMASIYAMKLRVLASKLKDVIQVADDRRIRVQPLTTNMGIQVDSYNCGVYNLLAFEMFVNPGAEPDGLVELERYGGQPVPTCPAVVFKSYRRYTGVSTRLYMFLWEYPGM
ncbi:hypothetical protein PR003_g2886 [Phytophthora rubi]|uniref:Ubiquitin-like protease family profile domain-containing protein n=1 Tax=Phytophthora rubi TaxID=129364 RepID=A0A6A3NXD6_9STRA|nr:hypothetical protein PR002_g1070 [Phytophthora rubi]KAE9052011.1 hypothetical protein PR001_g898 [Phytophthora rubi]KAE9355362.1 hypothetical protein PR003_g2886 [Phytophthora rubi]